MSQMEMRRLSRPSSSSVGELSRSSGHSGGFSNNNPFDNECDNPDTIRPVPRNELEVSESKEEVEHEKSILTKHQKPAQPVKEVKVSLLRYRKRSLCLLACYLPFLIVPWALTCVLAIRPPSLPSYFNQKGEYSANLYLVILFWMAFVRVLNAIASLLTVPVISALLAQGAVVYSQRRKAKQSLNMRQTFALADRGWADIPILWGARGGDGTSSKYLWLATGLLIISAIQAPVQQALVNDETLVIMTCNDNPIFDFSRDCDPLRLQTIIAYDPEPWDLAQIPQDIVVRSVAKNLATVYEQDEQLRLWHDPATNVGNVMLDNMADSNKFFWYYNVVQPGTFTYFVSALPNNTDTGILREHVMRLNSTVDCKSIAEDAFPSPCGGPNPFVTSFNSPGNLNIDICVPGNFSATPWTLSRDRQDIVEDLFIKVLVGNQSEISGYDLYGGVTNFTVQCTGTTTRGYFELANWRNNFIAGPLIDKWPDNDTLWNDFNDYLNYEGNDDVPSTINEYSSELPVIWSTGPVPFDSSYSTTPGPLMTSALAMFGNESFFYVAANSSDLTYPSASSQICQAMNIPFLRFNIFADTQYDQVFGTCSDIESAYNMGFSDNSLAPMLYQWMAVFAQTGTTDSQGYPWSDNYAKEALEVAMFFANEAWLTETAAATTEFTARNIFTSPGSPVFRPSKTLAGTIIISVLIFLQIVGLAVLAWYIYSVPTWTPAMDSYAVAQLGKSLDEDVLAPIGSADKKSFRKLKDVDGLIGIEHECESTADERVDKAGAPGAFKDQSDVRPDSAQQQSSFESSAMLPGADHDTEAGESTAKPHEKFKLARGGAGRITKKYAPSKRKRGLWKRKADKKSVPGVAV